MRTPKQCTCQVVGKERQGDDGIIRRHLDVEMRYFEETVDHEVVCTVRDVSLDEEALRSLVSRMNAADMDPIYFLDVIEDFCQDEHRIL